MLKNIICKVGYGCDIDIVELEILLDHIHRIVWSELKNFPSDVMWIMKEHIRKRVFRLHLEIKREYFGGEKLWAKSNFVETIENAGEEIIRKYVL